MDERVHRVSVGLPVNVHAAVKAIAKSHRRSVEATLILMIEKQTREIFLARSKDGQ